MKIVPAGLNTLYMFTTDAGVRNICKCNDRQQCIEATCVAYNQCRITHRSSRAPVTLRTRSRPVNSTGWSHFSQVRH